MTTTPTDFLGQLGAGERAALLRLGKRRTLRRGEFVFRVGDAKRGVFLLTRGRLKFFRITPEGREVILWFCFPGELFGISEVPAAKGRRVNVEACEDSEIASIGEAAFNRFLDEHPAAARLCRRTMAARLGMLTNTLVNLVAEDAYARVAKLIYHLGAHHGTRLGKAIALEVALTHQEIADMTGVNRQTVTTILGDLRRKRVLSVQRRRIVIDDPVRLSAAIHLTS